MFMSHRLLTAVAACSLVIAPQFSRQAASELKETTLAGHTTAVLGLAFSPDGTRLITTSWRAIRQWDPVKGELVKEQNARGYAVAFSPDGERIAYSGFDDVWLTEAEEGEVLHRIDAHGDWDRDFPFRPTVSTMVWSPDGERLFTAGSRAEVGGPHGYPGGIVKIFATETGAEHHRFEKLSHIPSSMAVNADATLLAVSTRGAGGELPEPGEVRLWDLETRKRLWIRRIQGDESKREFYRVLCVAFTPDNKHLLSAWNDGKLRLLSLETGETVRDLSGESRWFRRIAFHPDGEWFASGGSDGKVRLWELGAPEPKHIMTLGAPVAALAFSPDGSRIAAGGGDSFRSGVAKVWDLGEALQGQPGR